jgi:hypothetical protein
MGEAPIAGGDRREGWYGGRHRDVRSGHGREGCEP